MTYPITCGLGKRVWVNLYDRCGSRQCFSNFKKKISTLSKKHILHGNKFHKTTLNTVMHSCIVNSFLSPPSLLKEKLPRR